MIPLDSWEIHNADIDGTNLMVRDALRSHVLSTDILAGCQFAAGFSIESGNTSEVFHYLFLRNTATSDGYVYVVDEEYHTIDTLRIGFLPARPTITYAVQNMQILINGPEINPLYGLVGGGLVPAVKVASANPSTTAIEIPNGICCTFGDRIVVAEFNNAYFNDPGTEIRTFVAENALSLPGNIYDMFQGAAGALFFITSDGIYVLPSDALGQAQQVFGFLAKVSTYQASSHRNAVATRNELFALSRDGLSSIADSIRTMSLTDYTHKRFYSDSVGAGSLGDYRHGTLWKTESGCLVNIDGRCCDYDATTSKTSWIYNSGDIDMVGMCRSRDGTDLWVLPDRIVQQIGNVEYDSVEIKGIACGIVPVEPANSTMVRAITTSSDNVGQDQFVYLAGTDKTATTPKPSRAENVIGTDVWDAAQTLYGHETRSRRHLMAIRTDEIAVEVGCTGSGSRLGVIDILTRPVSPKRPTN